MVTGALVFISLGATPSEGKPLLDENFSYELLNFVTS